MTNKYFVIHTVNDVYFNKLLIAFLPFVAAFFHPLGMEDYSIPETSVISKWSGKINTARLNTINTAYCAGVYIIALCFSCKSFCAQHLPLV